MCSVSVCLYVCIVIGEELFYLCVCFVGVIQWEYAIQGILLYACLVCYPGNGNSICSSLLPVNCAY